MSRFRSRARLGLRARIVLAFGLGAALLSTLLASTTWGLTRENLLNNRDRLAVDRVLTNAVILSKTDLGPDADVATALQGVTRPEGATALIRVNDKWTGINPVAFGRNNVDPRLLALVEGGSGARMRYEVNGEPNLVVGVPIPSQQAIYFEAVSLSELNKTLSGLAISLIGAAVVTTIAGFALGFYASGRALRPLVEVGEAAEAIAGGRLDTRLDTRDDPDLRPLTESFNHMVTALEDRIERDARFASEVSHELRSPLMTLTASIEVLENSREELSERSRTALDLLSHDLERFKQLVEDLLEISRFDAGAIHLDLEELFVGEMVQRAVAMSPDPAPVHVTPEASEIVVRVDKRRMAQVIANLLDNARKYGAGASEVVVEATPGHVRIRVEDNGPGVPTEERSVIFDRFSRGRAGGRRGDDLGTGLGLALIHEHVNLHGGRVWVEDRPDGAPGASFVVELPTVSPEDAEDAFSTVTAGDLPDPDLSRVALTDQGGPA